MLGSTAIIRNEPSCTNAACHQHKSESAVLGVLDIVYPLSNIEKTLRANTLTIIGLSLGFIILAGLAVSYLVNRMIYLPLRDLHDGAIRLAEGDLEKTIPVRSKDEFGQLAKSFNSQFGQKLVLCRCLPLQNGRQDPRTHIGFRECVGGKIGPGVGGYGRE